MDYGFFFGIFGTIVKNMNFTNAAKELHVTQTVLTKRLESVEKELGVRLIERRRGANRFEGLTPEGRIVLEASSSMGHTFRSMMFELEKSKQKNVRCLTLGTSIKYLFRPTFSAVRDKISSEGLPFYLKYNEQISDIPFSLIRDHRLDFALEPFSPMADIRSLVSIPVFISPAMLVVHESSSLAEKETTSVSALKDINIMTRAGQSDYSIRKHIHAVCNRHGFEPHLSMELNDSISGMVFENLDEKNAFFCPVAYKGYLAATVSFARFVRIEETDCAFDMRFFYRDDHDADAEAVARLVKEIEFTQEQSAKPH